MLIPSYYDAPDRLEGGVSMRGDDPRYSFNTANVPSIWTVTLEGDTTPRPFNRSAGAIAGDVSRVLPRRPLDCLYGNSSEWRSTQFVRAPLPSDRRPLSAHNASGKYAHLVARREANPLRGRASRRHEDSLRLADFRTTSGISLAEPTVVKIPKRPGILGFNDRFFGLSPDGKHVVVVAAADQNPSQPFPSTEINVAVNWLEELKQRVPGVSDIRGRADYNRRLSARCLSS